MLQKQVSLKLVVTEISTDCFSFESQSCKEDMAFLVGLSIATFTHFPLARTWSHGPILISREARKVVFLCIMEEDIIQMNI